MSRPFLVALVVGSGAVIVAGCNTDPLFVREKAPTGPRAVGAPLVGALAR